MTSVSTTAPPREAVLRSLNRLRVVAILDALLLVPLVVASFSDADGLVGILGPIHGFGFLVMLYLTVRGAAERFWGWWFPALVVVTLGPPGSLIGDLKVRRELQTSSR